MKPWSKDIAVFLQKNEPYRLVFNEAMSAYSSSEAFGVLGMSD